LKFKSFKVQLRFILVILILVPVLVTAYTFIDKNTSYIEKNVYTQNMQLAENLNSQIVEMINGAESLMEMLSNLEKVKELNPELMNVPLQEAVKAYPLVSQIYVMDKTGMQIYKTSGALGDRSDREYFQKAMKGETSYSDVLILRSTNQPIVVLAKPIKNNGKIIGVIGASLDLSVLSEFTAKVKLGEGGYPFIVEGNGKVIAHPNQQLVEEMFDLSELTPVKNVIKGDRGQAEYTYEGEAKLASYVFMEKTGWGI